MLTPKISPQAYNEFISALSLKNVRLKDATVKCDGDNIGSGQIMLKPGKPRSSFKQDKRKVDVSITYKIEGFNYDTQATVLSITATFLVTYDLKEELEITKDFFDIFKAGNIHVITWPYFREFAQSTSTRMGFPPLTLPPIVFKK